MKRLLTIFVLLQIADFVTTMVAISLGGGEQNPLVLRFMNMGTWPGLLAAKLVVLALALAIARSGRIAAIRKASFVFGGVVLWNLSIIGRLMMPLAAR